ncbi:unnamed protein product (macronuclear) [Paramecium tetraurelia]|uniref:GRIP domain-containing protein n=1 Tax=Paramecium tetraurelia TaxID=5888 RepID=A0CMG9_PARTE|nr:uncharacterized protein GSPATT00008465001 [Paramecium tetraurelia]CAK71986.1 unnamed protein product [Paramecium tetraurelia]|eukprot:XP_001439383.1 hypothetical protein (macronuclear) [Paramecium tetraurelia strain d4-2]
MNELAQINEYIKKIEEMYSESFFEKRMNDTSSEEKNNEIKFMMEQINQDQGVIENLIYISLFLIGTLQAKQDDEQENNDFQEKQRKQLLNELQQERDQILQYKNLYHEKCQIIDEQLNVISDLEQQVSILKNQNTNLENQNLRIQRSQIDNGSITEIIQLQEQQLVKNQNFQQELQAVNQKLKSDLQANQIEINDYKDQIEELNLLLKQMKFEFSQLKLQKQQQDILIQSLEQDLKIQNEIVIDYEIQIDQLKEQIRSINITKMKQNEKAIEKKGDDQDYNLQNSAYTTNLEATQFSEVQQSNYQQTQPNLKLQLPLLSYRQQLYKFQIPEVSERQEQSDQTQKGNQNESDLYTVVSTFEVNQVEKENLRDKIKSVQEDNQIESAPNSQFVSQTARLDLNKTQIPKFQFSDINNRITVAKQRKSKTIEQVGVQQYLQQLGKRSNSKIIEIQKSYPDPYYIFFELLVQCVKMNSDNFDEIYSVNTETLYKECQKEGKAYFEWQDWVQKRLNIEQMQNLG